jgi:hypothetical protein
MFQTILRPFAKDHHAKGEGLVVDMHVDLNSHRESHCASSQYYIINRPLRNAPHFSKGVAFSFGEKST